MGGAWRPSGPLVSDSSKQALDSAREVGKFRNMVVRGHVKWFDTTEGYGFVVSTDGGGVTRVVGGRVVPGPDVPRLRAGVAWPVVEDREGTLWVGTYADGLFRIRDGAATHYGMADGLPSDGRAAKPVHPTPT